MTGTAQPVREKLGLMKGPASYSFFTCTEQRNLVDLVFPGRKHGKHSCPRGKISVKSTKSSITGVLCWALCEMPHAAWILHMPWFSWALLAANISTGLWLHALDWYCSYETAFSFFPHKFNTKRGVLPSLKVVHIQLIIGPLGEFQTRAWTWFDIPGTLSRGWGTTCSHSVWVTSSQHPCTQAFL